MLLIQSYARVIGGVLCPGELQVQNESVHGQVCRHGGRQVFLRWTRRTKNLRTVRGHHQGQVQIPDHYFYESKS